MKTKNYFPPTGILSVILIMLVMLGAGTNQHLKANQPNMPGIAIDAPVALDATEITDISFKANWQSVNNAEYYELYVYKKVGTMPVTGQPLYMIVSGYDGRQVQGTSIVVQGLSANLQHKYHVVAIGSQYEESSSSNTIYVTTKLTSPVATDATNITPVSFTANWDAVTGATSYKIFMIDAAENYIYNGLSVAGTSFNATGLTPNSLYRYRLSAVNSSGESDKSNIITLTTSAATPPTLKAASSITHNSFQANWNQANGATSYKLYVSKRATKLSWEVLKTYNGKTVTGKSTLVDGLNADSEYKYELKAVYNTHESDLSESETLFTLPVAPVASAATSVTTNSFQANWGAVTSATGYKLWVWSNEGTGNNPAGYFPATLGNVTSHVLSNLESGHSYSYFVQTITANGISLMSNTINVTTKPIAPTAMNASEVSSNSFRANWQTVIGATDYKLYVYRVSDQQWVPGYYGKTVSGTSDVISGLNPSTHYRYTVTTLMGGEESDHSNIINVNTLAAQPASYTLTLSVLPAGAGTVSGGGGPFNEGTTVTAHAEANTGFAFVNWTENGKVVSSSASYVFQISANRNLVANFSQIPATRYTIALTASPSNMGSVSGGGDYPQGTDVTVSATPASKAYRFVNWTEGKTIVSTDANYSFTVTADRNLVANFEQNAATTYTIAVTASPSNMGSASGGGTYTEGASVTVSATASSKMFHFVNWTEGKTIVSTDANYTFTATADRNLVANFEQNAATTYAVDVAVLPASSGTANGGGTFNEGSSVTVTATPAEGFAFVNWTEGGTEVSTNAAYTFTLNANRSLVANFEELPPATFTIKASAYPSKGGTTSIGTKTYTEGTTITISANANAGYHFVNWTENGEEVSSSNNYSFTVTEDRTLVANFEQDAAQTYTVELKVNGGEGGTVNFSSQSFEMGASVTAIATPADDYVFTKWMEGATQISTNAEYTFLVGGDITLTAYFDKKTASEFTSERNVRVYPNPAVAKITVSGLEAGSCVKLIDLAGSTVIKQQATNNELDIDVSNLRCGCYYVVVEQNEIFDSRKVILK